MPSSQVDTGTKSFTAGEDLAIFRLVKLTSGTLNYADAGEDSIGVTQNSADSGDQVSVKLWNSAGTFKVESAGTIVTETAVYVANDAKVDDAVSGSIIGVSVETGSTAGDYVEFVKAEPTDIHVKSAHIADVSATFAAGSIDTGVDMTAAQAAQLVADIAALIVAVNAHNTALEASGLVSTS